MCNVGFKKLDTRLYGHAALDEHRSDGFVCVFFLYFEAKVLLTQSWYRRYITQGTYIQLHANPNVVIFFGIVDFCYTKLPLRSEISSRVRLNTNIHSLFFPPFLCRAPFVTISTNEREKR